MAGAPVVAGAGHRARVEFGTVDVPEASVARAAVRQWRRRRDVIRGTLRALARVLTRVWRTYVPLTTHSHCCLFTRITQR